MTEKPDVTKLVLDLMKKPTDRDQQVVVGASNFSTPCARCVAEALVAMGGSVPNQWWMGAWNGTAIHNRLDDLTTKYRPTWEPEQKIVLGSLKGYGTIKSTTDLYVPEYRLCADYKSTTRDKLKYIKDALTTPPGEFDSTKRAEARFKVTGYKNQVFSYVSLVFICRDGLTDKDVWDYTEPYDPVKAEAVWNRLERLWAWIKAGHTPDEMIHMEHCYYRGREE
jgi:hypothetical protein